MCRDNRDATPAGLDLLQRGAAAYRSGNPAEALRLFEQAARTGAAGVRASALINAAAMLDELGDHHTALARYREALATLPADAVEKRISALINYSQALQHLGALDEAQTALEQARALLAEDDDLPGHLRMACLTSSTAVAFHRAQWPRVIELATESLDAAVRFAPELSGHPLMNLAGAYFETGRTDLGIDFARQALAAFESAGDTNALAESRQDLAVLLSRTGHLDEAEDLLLASQEYFDRAGLAHRAGIGLKNLGYLAERRADPDRADQLYRRALEHLESSGAVLDAAAVRTRLATVAYLRGDMATGRDLLAVARRAYADRGLGLHCAQLDYWHAALLETIVDATARPAPELLALGRDLAVPAAITIDAVRYRLPNGHQRERWNREIAEPAMRLAFRFAALCGDGPLVADLIETRCAGTTVDLSGAEPPRRPELPPEPLSPELAASEPTEPEATDPGGAPPLRLGAALAHIAAAAGLPVTPPPRLALAPDGHIALAHHIAAAEQRYGLPVRTDQILIT
ncbi:tetratricopeptide repeat protein [Nocardia farcinica]|uniref:tetratricopeptide repeat protein n=1 Tax=Nocardia farcinica TaxID=37329 RepID=UPI0024580C95|nr:tetratricopeptide repeat protein [Nocardia farcinica]